MPVPSFTRLWVSAEGTEITDNPLNLDIRLTRQGAHTDETICRLKKASQLIGKMQQDQYISPRLSSRAAQTIDRMFRSPLADYAISDTFIDEYTNSLTT